VPSNVPNAFQKQPESTHQRRKVLVEKSCILRGFRYVPNTGGWSRIFLMQHRTILLTIEKQGHFLFFDLPGEPIFPAVCQNPV
jgi:hypothetical protein